jgi:hypothetical protein
VAVGITVGIGIIELTGAATRISRALLERLQLDFMRVSMGVPIRTCVKF